MAKQAKRREMPSMIYVKWSDDGDGNMFLLADTDPASLLETDTQDIGCYSLTSVRRGRLGPTWEK